MSAVLCLITDRRRRQFEPQDAAAATHDTPPVDSVLMERLVTQVQSAAQAGVDLVQLRERDLDGGALCALASRCVDAVRGTRTRVIVNDRLDVALAAGAHGVHLRSDSFAASRARHLAPRGFLIGRSVHDEREAIDAATNGGLDYLIFGPVYETMSKPGKAGTGVGALHAVAAATRLPVLAVGGISGDRFDEIARAGAAGIAAIGLFTAPSEGLAVIVNEAARAFNA